MSKHESPSVVNEADVDEIEHTFGAHYGAAFKCLTPGMTARGGKLGVNRMRLPKGRTTCPFHYHQREDEAFFVLSGRGVLRYGEELREIRAGDCVSCPAGTQIAHQIANPFDEELVYLAIGNCDPDEVCVYPDSDKVMVRSLHARTRLGQLEYFDSEPQPPKIFELAKR